MIRISKKRILLLTLVFAFVGNILADTAFAVQSYTVPLAQFQSPNYNEDCVWFALVGIPQADPLVPDSPWFARRSDITKFTRYYWQPS
jgi:hypothetical protein